MQIGFIGLGAMGALIVPRLLGRAGPLSGARRARDVERDRRAAEDAAVVGAGAGQSTDGVPPQAYDRVVRIVAWSFLLAVTVMVAVTGLWPEAQSTIFALVALAGLFVLVVHDLLPSDALGPVKYVLEGSVAITFATLLVQHEPTYAMGVSSEGAKNRSALRSSHRDTVPVGPFGSPTLR